MTWLEFKRKVGETTSQMSSEEVPVTFLHGVREICPDDITVECEMTGDRPVLVVVLEENGPRARP